MRRLVLEWRSRKLEGDQNHADRKYRIGPAETANLGFTLSHEHLATNAAGILRTFPELIDRPGIIEEAKSTLKEASDEGLRTIIDVSTIDLGRDVEMMKEVSQATGVQIIAATGNHLAVPRPFIDLAPEVIAYLFVREIEQGIEGTRIKTGIIKVAIDEGGITGSYRAKGLPKRETWA